MSLDGINVNARPSMAGSRTLRHDPQHGERATPETQIAACTSWKNAKKKPHVSAQKVRHGKHR